jgi:hypothetical protein
MREKKILALVDYINKQYLKRGIIIDRVKIIGKKVVFVSYGIVVYAVIVH